MFRQHKQSQLTASMTSPMGRDLPYWVAFTRVPSVGSVRVGLLEQQFGSLEAAWHASSAELRASGLGPSVANAIAAIRPRVDPAREMAGLDRAGVQAVTWHDAAYPRLLREIPDLPPVLFVKGELGPERERLVTVVGTRSPTAYGREAARHLATDLARAGVTVVSGLARGIDAVAHRAALEQGSRTLAVLGSGIDIMYPPEHAPLAEEIAQHGALLSEYPLGVRPDGKNFPRRNRLLSGLSLGTLVIEAAVGSGALWTVRHALEQGREVLCVPGSIYSPASRLTNRLIQEGAKPVLQVEDVLEELNLSALATVQQPLPGLAAVDTDEEAHLLSALELEPQHVDELSHRSGLPITTVVSTVALLELKGLAPAGGPHALYPWQRGASPVFGLQLASS